MSKAVLSEGEGNKLEKNSLNFFANVRRALKTKEGSMEDFMI